MAIYLAIETASGDIGGDVVNPKGYKDQILLHSVSFDFYREADSDGTLRSRMKSGGARFSANFGPHAILIWRALTLGEQVVGAIITYDSSDEGDDPTVQLELTDGRIASCNFSASGGMGAASLDFTILFQHVSVQHVPSGQMHEDTLAHQTL